MITIEEVKPGDILKSNEAPGFNWDQGLIKTFFSNLSTKLQEEIIANPIQSGEYHGAYRPDISFKIISTTGSIHRETGCLARILDGRIAGKYIVLYLDRRLDLIESDPDDNY